MRTPLLIPAVVCLSAVVALSGCAMSPVYVGPDLRRGSTAAETVAIDYKLDAAQLQAPLAVARIEGQLVSYEEMPGIVLPKSSTGLLKVRYPHDEALPGYARVEVSIAAAPLPALLAVEQGNARSKSWIGQLGRGKKQAAEAAQETWALDVPKNDIDTLLGRLATPGSVEAKSKGSVAGAELSATFNGRKTIGPCTPVPELDALMRRVRSEGALVAYSRPLLSARRKQAATSSLAAYRALETQRGDDPVERYLYSDSETIAQRTGLDAPTAAAPSRLAERPR